MTTFEYAQLNIGPYLFAKDAGNGLWEFISYPFKDERTGEDVINVRVPNDPTTLRTLSLQVLSPLDEQKNRTLRSIIGNQYDGRDRPPLPKCSSHIRAAEISQMAGDARRWLANESKKMVADGLIKEATLEDYDWFGYEDDAELVHGIEDLAKAEELHPVDDLEKVLSIMYFG